MDINLYSKSMVHKKIASEIAVGIVLIIVIIIGGLVCFNIFKTPIGPGGMPTQNENSANNTTDSDYYNKLKSNCNGSGCCLSSVNVMEKRGFEEAESDGQCDEGFQRNMMLCFDSLRWCEPMVDGITTVTATIEQQDEKIGNYEKTLLFEIAKEYILNKPQLFVNKGGFVAWDNYGELGGLSKTSPEWIISQNYKIRHVESGKYESPNENINDEYIVSWFFIPGCGEDSSSADKPIWLDKNGNHCLGGYNLDVIINSDSTVNRAELNALN